MGDIPGGKNMNEFTGEEHLKKYMEDRGINACTVRGGHAHFKKLYEDHIPKDKLRHCGDCTTWAYEIED